MILHGENLFIKVNGEVIAGAKTCKVQVQSDTIGVSSPTDGQWEHSIPGRKSWSVSTGHLVLSRQAVQQKMSAEAYAYKGLSLPNESKATTSASTTTATQTGITVIVYNSDMTVLTSSRFDTYNSQEAQQVALISFVDTNIKQSGKPWAIITCDTLKLNDTTRTAIATILGLQKEDVPVISGGRCAWVALGVDGQASISNFQLGDGAVAHATLLLGLNNVPLTDTPLKSAINRVGQVVEISVEVEGFAHDRVSGTAICTQFDTQGTKGTLVQGSYSWKGSGPIE